LEHAGQLDSCTEAFDNVGHVNSAKRWLKEFIIGILEGYEKVKEKVLFVEDINSQKLKKEIMTSPLIVYEEEEKEACGIPLFLKTRIL
jgi:cytochrome b involved in lipid metabolism